MEAAKAYNEYSDKKNELAKYLICVECGERKNKNEFYKDKRKVIGISSVCKICHKIYVILDYHGLKKNEETKKFAMAIILIHKLNNK